MNLMQTLGEMEQAGKPWSEMLALVLKHEPTNLPLLVMCTGRYIGGDERPGTFTLPWVEQMLQADVSTETIRQLLRHLCLTGEEWTSTTTHCKAFLNEKKAWEVFENEESFLQMLFGIAKVAPSAVFEAAYRLAFYFGCRQAPEKKEQFDSLIRRCEYADTVTVHSLIAQAQQLEQEIARAGQRQATMVLKEASHHLVSIPHEPMFDLIIKWLEPTDQIRIARRTHSMGYGAVLKGYILCNGSIGPKETTAIIFKARQDLQRLPEKAGDWYRNVLYGASLARYPNCLPEDILGTVRDAGWVICRLETWENPRYGRRDLQVQGWDRRGRVRVILKQNPDPKIEGSNLREGDQVMIPPDPEVGLNPDYTDDRLAIYWYNFRPASPKKPT